MTVTEISAPGQEALVAAEGDVLKAYRCPAGVWTISAGLTAASGVVKPHRGMVITRAESRRLLGQALTRNYVPRVIRRGLNRTQHELDGATMFDFNTGRIHNASWVRMWLRGAPANAERSFMSWNKAGGRVLRGLSKRRAHEWEIIAHGRYRKSRAPVSESSEFHEIRAYQADLKKLGYLDGTVDGIVGVYTKTAVRKFQTDKGLDVDGLVGPATRAAIKRALEGRSQAKATTGSGVAGTGGTGAIATGTGSDASADLLIWSLGIGAGLAALVLLLFLAWRYRGPLFSWLPEGAKDWAEDKIGVTVGRRVAT